MDNLTTTSTAPVGSEGNPNIALLAFSSVTIRGLASRKGKHVPVTLLRAASFPARRFTLYDPDCDELEGWDSLVLPEGKPHLELKLGKRLAVGRIGFIYAARILRILDKPGGIPILNHPIDISTKLVIKLVRPTNCRSLAREAWFYERLPEEEGYQGAVVPRCYGFYTTSTSSILSRRRRVQIGPWIDESGSHVPLDFSELKESEDFLPDDSAVGRAFRDDGRTCWADSPWSTWQPDPENPLLGVLILERLGATYSRKTYDENPQSRMDIADLVDDLSSVTIQHDDFKFNNIVRTPSGVVCPRHGYAHEWRVIDFDRSVRWAKTANTDESVMSGNRSFYDRKYFPTLFWGYPEEYC
ncbi:hypothetical protein Hypma_006396 [Hypsizygus marmoreus]|uniref:Protein kinase domain-containing protein n=1 Tax=Hypsizygus marmoreus TaxID=39966 RepID=A0A369JW55_HYPMA|nr:hypothetical protein Hypma_006396 [Hypsizygus marmoreus]